MSLHVCVMHPMSLHTYVMHPMSLHAYVMYPNVFTCLCNVPNVFTCLCNSPNVFTCLCNAVVSCSPTLSSGSHHQVVLNVACCAQTKTTVLDIFFNSCLFAPPSLTTCSPDLIKAELTLQQISFYVIKSGPNIFYNFSLIY